MTDLTPTSTTTAVGNGDEDWLLLVEVYAVEEAFEELLGHPLVMQLPAGVRQLLQRASDDVLEGPPPAQETLW